MINSLREDTYRCDQLLDGLRSYRDELRSQIPDVCELTSNEKDPKFQKKMKAFEMIEAIDALDDAHYSVSCHLYRIG